jgi:hypothetical protein
MKVMVSGDRNWKKFEEVFKILDDLNKELGGITLIIEGGARGVDTIAREWAKQRKVKFRTFAVTPAEWTAIGPGAGPKRNQRMIDTGKPDRAIGVHRAIEYSKGTRDCLEKAQKAEIPTRLYPKGQAAFWSTF